MYFRTVARFYRLRMLPVLRRCSSCCFVPRLDFLRKHGAETVYELACKLSLSKATRPSTGCLKIAVVALPPCHVTSRGSPVFRETSFIPRCSFLSAFLIARFSSVLPPEPCRGRLPPHRHLSRFRRQHLRLATASARHPAKRENQPLLRDSASGRFQRHACSRAPDR